MLRGFSGNCADRFGLRLSSVKSKAVWCSTCGNQVPVSKRFLQGATCGGHCLAFFWCLCNRWLGWESLNPIFSFKSAEIKHILNRSTPFFTTLPFFSNKLALQPSAPPSSHPASQDSWWSPAQSPPRSGLMFGAGANRSSLAAQPWPLACSSLGLCTLDTESLRTTRWSCAQAQVNGLWLCWSTSSRLISRGRGQLWADFAFLPHSMSFLTPTFVQLSGRQNIRLRDYPNPTSCQGLCNRATRQLDGQLCHCFYSASVSALIAQWSLLSLWTCYHLRCGIMHIYTWD